MLTKVQANKQANVNVYQTLGDIITFRIYVYLNYECINNWRRKLLIYFDNLSKYIIIKLNYLTYKLFNIINNLAYKNGWRLFTNAKVYWKKNFN